ncbi:MAG: beta strand repeat-containing protein, partial [Casimicrobium sp.]
LANVVTPSATNYQVFYTTAAPGTIDVNPKCPSNTGAGPGAWPAFAPGVPPPAGCTGSAGSTTWTAATGGPTWTGFPAGATAIMVIDKNNFVNSTTSRLVTMDFATPGSRDGDRYSNNVSAAHGGAGTALTDASNPSSGNGPGATFNTFSNNVTVRVIAATLSGTVFVDPDGDGATTGFESGTDTGLGGVTVTLRKGASTVGTAVTATAAIAAGNFYNPATGGSSATAGPGLCPVPATGLAVGQYLFCDLVAGTDYTLVETQPSGYATTGDRAGTGSPAGTVTSATDTISGIGLTVGQDATGYDFGEATLTTVSGRVYVESNGNTADNGNTTDPGIGSVSVALTCTPTYTGTSPVNTNANGEYSFAGVSPGASCTITQTQPSPYTNAYATPGTSSTPGSEAGNAAGSTTNGTISIVVPLTGSPNNNFAEQAADMRSNIACVPAGPAGGASTTCTVTCTNFGPGVAVSPLCTITNASSLPGNPTVVCTPNPLPASLANNGAVSCSVTFNAPTSGTLDINGSTGATNDNNGGTNLTGANSGNNPSTTQINIVPADMRPAFSNLPAAVGPGTLYTGLVLTCSNVGSSVATQASCVPTASAGTVSNVVCVSQPPVDVAIGGNIRCTFDYTAPPAQGGTNTSETAIDFFGRTTASNDSVGGSDTTVCAVTPVAPNNNCVQATVPVVDAIDDAPSTQQFATTGSTNYPLLTNDQLGATTNPAIGTGGVSAPTITGVTRGGTAITNPFTVDATGALVVPNNTPPGVYVVTYQICANGTTNACDTATKTVTIEASDMTSAIVCTPSGAAAGTPMSCVLTCTNRGPNVANNATCAFTAGLPTGTTVSCVPTSPATTVAVNATIVCTTSNFSTPATPTQITGGTGAENDSNGGTTPSAGNNPAAASIGSPPLPVPAMGAFGLGALLLMLAAAGIGRRRTMR